MNGQNRANVKIGAKVSIVLKADQRTGERTDGVVVRLLTNSRTHPHGIKVILEDGQLAVFRRFWNNKRSSKFIDKFEFLFENFKPFMQL